MAISGVFFAYCGISAGFNRLPEALSIFKEMSVLKLSGNLVLGGACSVLVFSSLIMLIGMAMSNRVTVGKAKYNGVLKLLCVNDKKKGLIITIKNCKRSDFDLTHEHIFLNSKSYELSL